MAQPRVPDDRLVAIACDRHRHDSEQRDDGARGRNDERCPHERGETARLEGAQPDEGDQGSDGRDDEDEADPERTLFAAIIDHVGAERSEPHEAAEDRGVPADAERHGKSLSVGRGGTEASKVDMGVERAEQDIRDVEGPERPFRENEFELVAIAGTPARRIEAEEEGDHERLSLETDRGA